MQDILDIRARATNKMLPSCIPWKPAILLYSCTLKRYNTGLQHNFPE